MRSKRLIKKLHKNWLVEVASQIVMDENIEQELWSMNQGDSKEISSSNYSGSEIMQKFDLSIIIERGQIKGHWLHKEFDAAELNLYFYAKQFPNIAHGWTLFEEDREI